MEDELLLKLINKTVADEARKELYVKSLPTMTDEERIGFTAGLLQMLMTKLHYLAVQKVEGMVEEMAENDTVTYEKKDFQAAYDEEVTKFLSEQLQVTDQNELQQLRESLNAIGKKVQEHDDVISRIKDKI